VALFVAGVVLLGLAMASVPRDGGSPLGTGVDPSVAPSASATTASPSTPPELPPRPGVPTIRPTLHPPNGRDPDPVSPTATASRLRDEAFTGDILVNGDMWLDLDPAQPTMASIWTTTFTADIDLQVGPDNLYPHNGATVWVKMPNSTCTSQRSQASAEQLPLKDKLAQRPETPIEVCAMTTRGTFLKLAVSTSKVGGGAPYRIRYAPD
jgi:hypothetical protein